MDFIAGEILYFNKPLTWTSFDLVNKFRYKLSRKLKVKKIKVGQAVAEAIGLQNVTFRHCRGEEEKQTFDFVVSRAVMPLADLVKIIRKNIRKEQINALPNGLICLKGGELAHEILPFKNQAIQLDLSDTFSEEYFKTKKVVYVPL